MSGDLRKGWKRFPAGNDHYSDVIAYSPEAYAAGRLEKSKDANMIALMKAMVTYGEAAKNYFV